MNWKSSDQAISWFKERAEDGTLSLEEPYQRKPVWTLKERCYLIESILIGVPIPEIFIHRTTSPEGKSHYGVVDGQQRVRTILKFIGMDESDPEDNSFSLVRLNKESLWFGQSFEELPDDAKELFWDYSLSVRILISKDAQEIRDMFVRLNRFQMPLKGQELRHAWFTGAFGKLATFYANDNFFAQNEIVTPATIRRMGDVELVGELLAGCMSGPQEGSRAKIDIFYESLELYQDEIPGEANVKATYEKALTFLKTEMPHLGSRWRNKHDFYSLFVALAHYIRDGYTFSGNRTTLRKRLTKLGIDVGRYIEDEDAKVSAAAKEYARAVQKGPSSKARRAARHQVLLQLLKPFFKAPTS